MNIDRLDISAELLSNIEGHCFSENLVEVGGFLVGEIAGNRTVISAFIPAQHAVQADTHLTFSHDTWDAAYKHLEKAFPGKKLIGWYHTHPDFGCFLSDYDQFIQTNFFPDPNHVALVIDPIRGELAWFASAEGKIIELSQDRTSSEPVARSKEEVLTQMTVSRTRTRGRVLGVIVSALLIGLAGLVSFSFGQNLAQSKFDVKLSAAQAQAGAEKTVLQGQISALQNQADLDQTVAFPYVAKDGDSVWSIAQCFLGDGKLYGTVLKWNPSLKDKPLEAGQTVMLHFTGRLVKPPVK
jgi:proteasome lid subunit RPN8/RPN11